MNCSFEVVGGGAVLSVFASLVDDDMCNPITFVYTVYHHQTEEQ